MLHEVLCLALVFLVGLLLGYVLREQPAPTPSQDPSVPLIHCNRCGRATRNHSWCEACTRALGGYYIGGDGNLTYRGEQAARSEKRDS